MTSAYIHNSAQWSATKPERLLVGDSPIMRELREDILLTSTEDITVLITGESGAGKELVAQAIHKNSKRVGGPFKAINCGALTESLLESRLFGHVKGAFTGAAGAQSGLFEAANGGTIFLDEIGDMPISLQGYLLRVLQERMILPVGSHAEKRVDVRVIAATNKYLPREVREGRFRHDLYYRLNEFSIKAPALREHPSDIPLLVRHFLGSMKIEEKGLALLCSQPWPGNVRELKATIKRLALRAASQGVITTEHVRREIGQSEGAADESATINRNSQGRQDIIVYTGELRKGESFDSHFNRQKLAIYEELVRSTGGHTNAAKWLGLNPQSLHHRIRRLQQQLT
jgi:two-component system nitrogen regulation response regulator GlnG